MSTAYRVRPALPFRQLLDDLPAGIEAQRHPDNDDCNQVLVCAGNYAWASTGDGSDTSFTRYGQNNVAELLGLVATKFDVVYSEHDPEFWDEDDRYEDWDDED